jgi:hypothetical protein
VAPDTKLIAEMIIVIAEQTAPYFARALTTSSKVTAEEVLPEIKKELCALYLHLLDRDAFTESGEEARNHFSDSLFEATSAKIDEKNGVDSDAFAEFVNQRQIEFSHYKELLAPLGPAPPEPCSGNSERDWPSNTKVITLLPFNCS